MSTIDDSVIARFWQKVNKTDSCWLWTGIVNRKGYGTLSIYNNHKSKNQLAHRVSWVVNKGPIPEGLLVLHKCDNPPCVNPEHLFLGTYQDNVDDMIRKGRKYYLTPKDYGNAKLNEKTVIELRRKAAKGVSSQSLATEYGICIYTVYAVIRGDTWRDLPVLGRPEKPVAMKKCAWCNVDFPKNKNGKYRSKQEFEEQRFCSISCGVCHTRHMQKLGAI